MYSQLLFCGTAAAAAVRVNRTTACSWYKNPMTPPYVAHLGTNRVHNFKPVDWPIVSFLCPTYARCRGPVRLTHEQAHATLWTRTTAAPIILHIPYSRDSDCVSCTVLFPAIIRFADVRSASTQRSTDSFFSSIFTSFVAAKTTGKYFPPSYRPGDVFRRFTRLRPQLCGGCPTCFSVVVT